MLAGWSSGQNRYGAVEHFVRLSKAAKDPVVKELHLRVADDQIGRSVFGGRARESFAAGLSDAALEALEERIGREVWLADQANAAWLKSQLKRIGWFRISQYGAEGDGSAFLLVQHADADRDFQREVLARLEPLARAKEAQPASYAYLYDRVAVGEGLPQRYGTQGRCTGPARWEPSEVEAVDRLDARRAEVGLPSMATYRAGFADICRKAD